MKHVIIGGASGLVGKALTASLQTDGIKVTTLVRRQPRSTSEVQWLSDGVELHPETLEGADAVVVLNGANVGRMPWTKKYKKSLITSRLQPAKAVASAMKLLGDQAPLYVSASAVGYYGSAPGQHLDESSSLGDTFLAKLCQYWEAAALKSGPDARVAFLRTAPILHREGVLKPLMLLTKFGIGGPIGSGEQKWPWISLTDEVRAIRHIIDHGITGPINLTGPQSATANDIGRALASEMNRPFWLMAPKFALRLVLGADATESLLTADADVQPEVLLDSGFEFEHPTVQSAVKAALK